MTMTGGKMHAFSGMGTAIAAAVVGVAVWWADSHADDQQDDDDDPFKNMEVIDAALAEKAPEEVVQPTKPTRPPDVAKPITVSRDADARPVTRPEEPAATPSIEDVLRRHRDHDEDLEEGPAQQPVVGRFDGSEDGFGDETRGDPYLGALKSDLLRAWEFPEILSDVGTPIGCIHLEPDGTIPEVVLREKSGNDELDDSVERALRALKKKRDEEPKPVPAHLIPKTRKWICYRMRV